MNSNVIEMFQEITCAISSGKMPRAKRPWTIHDDLVIIDEKLKENYIGSGNYGGTPEFLITPHYLEISWLMERLRDIYYDLGGLGLSDRYMFFIPILKAGMRVVIENPTASVQEVASPMFATACAIFAKPEIATESI